MSKLDKDYPRKYPRKKIIEEINSLSDDIMPHERSTFVSQAGTDRLLKLGKIQLGLNELQNRQSKKVMWVTIIISILSLLIAGFALFFSINGTKENQNTEDLRNQQNNQILNELKSIDNKVGNITIHKNDSSTIKNKK